MRIRPVTRLPILCCLTALSFLGAACVVGEDSPSSTPNDAGAHVSTGGSSGGGSSGSAGSSGAAKGGASGGAAGFSGNTGGSKGAGSAGSGGTTGRAGTGGTSAGTGGGAGSGSGGHGDVGGTSGAAGGGGPGGAVGQAGAGGGASGTMGAGGHAGAIGGGGVSGGGGRGQGGSGQGSGTPTFTEIYNSILTVRCGGSDCHNPGSQRGVSFSSKANAYSSARKLITAGNAENSTFYNEVALGAMPPIGDALSDSDLAMIKNWIDAGAMNN